ncbi:hypothetical protein VP01_3449g1 [Puccinia sorghi]|uniref:NodB homology domain-containing protein n=1 Tax=Puccinia sorghi TaxID=27349 RepID=A0A0L6UX28_9BASI|nr:hypothetical protein VP01_3449g1 [Puccinia sorghi]
MANNSVLSGTKRWEVSTLLILLLAALVNSRGPTRRAGRHHAHLVARDSVNGDHRRTRSLGSLLDHPGIMHNNQSVFGRRDEAGSVPVYEACSAPGSFSLTFDDGPSEYSAALDATLGRNNAKASFYINGNNAGCIYDYADLLLQRFKDGHLIASHTWSHVHLNQGSYEAISYQLQLLEDAMIKILGVKPLYFRPPYGSCQNANPLYIQICEYNDLTIHFLLLLRASATSAARQGVQGDDTVVAGLAGQRGGAAECVSNGLGLPHVPGRNDRIASRNPGAVRRPSNPACAPDPPGKEAQSDHVDISCVALQSPECLDLGSNPSDWYVAVQQPGSRDDSWTCDGTPTSESYDP